MTGLERTANHHYAAMRRAEDAARGLSVQYSVRRFAAGFDVDATAGRLAELAAVRDSYYMLAAAHRQAGRRLERGERWRARLERVVRFVVRGGIRAGRAAVTR